VFGLEKGKKLFPSNINLLLLALGGIIYGGVGIASIFLGEEFLSYNPLGSTPQSGQHIGILLVEFGVGLTVSNVMIALFNAFIGFKSGKAS
jgi:multicomponent Na+:H+ antiporter subunit B